MEYIILVLSVVLATSKSLLSKVVKTPSERAYKTFFSNVIIFLVAFGVVTLIGHKSLKNLEELPIILSFFYALFTVGAQISFMQAITIGPISFSSLLYFCSFLVPTIFGVVYYKESFHFVQIIGIALIVLALILSTEKGEKKLSGKWLIAIVISSFCSGMVAVVQLLFVKDYPQVSLDTFLGVAFGFMAVLSVTVFILLIYIEKKRCNKEKITIKLIPNKKEIFPLLVLGFVIGLVNKTNTYLAGVLPSIIFFPVMHGGTIFLTSILSMLLFKENLSIKQKIALLVGVVAILCIGIGKNL